MTNLNKLVSFYIGDKIFGIDMRFIQEFIEYIEYTELPEEINSITGVVNLRGRIITVSDMGLIFNNQRCAEKKLLMVMRSNFNRHEKSHKAPLALIVDDNGPIVEIQDEKLIEIPDFREGEINHLCSHAIQTESGVLSVIDPEKLYEVLLDESA